MAKRVNVSADVIERGNKVRLERHRVAGRAEIKGLGGFVAEMRGDDRPLEQLVRRHVVFDQKAEVDDALCLIVFSVEMSAGLNERHIPGKTSMRQAGRRAAKLRDPRNSP